MFVNSPFFNHVFFFFAVNMSSFLCLRYALLKLTICNSLMYRPNTIREGNNEARCRPLFANYNSSSFFFVCRPTVIFILNRTSIGPLRRPFVSFILQRAKSARFTTRGCPSIGFKRDTYGMSTIVVVFIVIYPGHRKRTGRGWRRRGLYRFIRGYVFCLIVCRDFHPNK